MKHVFPLLRYVFVLLIATLRYFVFGLVKLLYLDKTEAVHRTAVGWGSFILKHTGIEINVYGRENLSKTPAIFISNHQSILDLFIMCKLMPYKAGALAKQSIRLIPFLGWWMKCAGVVFIDRANRKKALRGMEVAKERMSEGYSMLVAAEGTRTRTGELQKLKRGAFHLAAQTGMHVIPVTVKNAYRLAPRHSWYPRPGTIDVYIDPPIDTSQWSETTIDQHIEQIRQIFLSHLSSKSTE